MLGRADVLLTKLADSIRLVAGSGRTKGTFTLNFYRIRILFSRDGKAAFVNTESCCSEGTQYYCRYTNSKAEPEAKTELYPLQL